MAKIFSLTSDRPGLQAWTTDRVIEFTQARAGRHFDPKIVDAFVKVIPSLLATVRRLHASTE